MRRGAGAGGLDGAVDEDGFGVPVENAKIKIVIVVENPDLRIEGCRFTFLRIPLDEVLGDLSIQGNIKAVRTLAEPLQVSMDNGARRALVPLENKRTFLEVSGDIVERVDPVFFSDPMTAAMKA